MRRERLSDASVAIHFGPDEEAVFSQFEILYEALSVYALRNAKYNDNWRRMGWRGMLIRVRERAERLWDHLWDAEPNLTVMSNHDPHDVDDAIDLINFAAFLVRGVREGDRDGEWW